MKDNFSSQSALYAAFRPTYPDELYDFLLPFVPSKITAWDCGTGNGQVAGVLTEYFEAVYATDISDQQLSHAIKKDNIFYISAPVEKPIFKENIFDMITVAQAIHWFDFDTFYQQVNRTLKPGGLMAVLGYGLIKINGEANTIINHFYKETLRGCWDIERQYIDDNYLTIPFPFEEIKTPPFAINFKWTLQDLIGYLSTWSAVQKYMQLYNADPVLMMQPQLEKLLGAQEKFDGHFPVLLRAGFKV